MPRRAQFAEQLGDAVVGAAVGAPARLVLPAVFLQDIGDLGIAGRRPAARGEHPADELLGAVADEGFHLFEAAGRQSAGLVDAVGGRGDVLDGVEQRPVEVEYHR